MININKTLSPIRLNDQTKIVDGSFVGSGTIEHYIVVESESILASLYAESVSGELEVKIFTIGKDGQETSVIEFPTLTAPTSNLLLRQPARIMQVIRVEITHTDDCTFNLYLRGVRSGAASVKIEGSENWQVTRASVTATAAILISASLEDRSAILIENISDVSGSAGTIWVGETLAKASVGAGHPLRSGGNYSIDLQAGTEIYAVSDSGTVVVSIIESGGG